MVAAQAQKHPDAVALRWPDGELSYRDLQTAIQRLAGHLAGTTRAALFNDRSPELAIAVLAVLSGGGSYVPLDNTYPRGRLDYMLADSGADRLLCRAHLANLITIPDGCELEILDPVLDDLHASDLPEWGAKSAPEDLAYISYTSGSTGRPKGVAMPHGALANLNSWQVANSGSTVGWNTLQLWPLSVDVSFQEIFGTWSSGGTLVLIEEDVRQDPRKLLAYIDEQQIHRAFLPFVSLHQVIEAAVQQDRYPASLREIITAGEQLQIGDSVRKFFTCTGATLENQYGTTETHVVTAEKLVGDPAAWPVLPSIGTAITNTVVKIVDGDMQPVSAGEVGEICIGGIAVADGYLNRPELTAERFRVWPGPNIPAYLTGDFGRLLPDGKIEFLGRRDTQVKINGSRVELGEVESQLRELPGVSDALVTVHPTASGQNVLAAHCVRIPGTEIEESVLRDGLSQVLPRHMVPAHYVVLDAFPFTPTGKVDRAALAQALPTV
ncbi:amino acid adenylation domain-containing protein [Streptomyces chiangmaiensis]|uniref:Amino acid adenylation domain-containing protein n=1 Tax=Streptomyces chiangmaiensis TaxID=766497 RepID=A0ABU7FI59_9ACTN|nr:amino acid adenylation domain-containing protein [Streptomyces chiangmaiensis]MED7823815.1 amino acid adenylation domain-containing protein [Streptomyces chiangmaiensis]